MKNFLLGIFALLFLMIASPAFATTYYASPSGGGAATCVDSGANVCTLQRAVTVAASGTNTILCEDGTYAISTALAFNATNTGANMTITPDTGANCILSSTGSTTVVDIQATMVSGTITFDGVNWSDTNTDHSIDLKAPQVNLVVKNAIINNSDATSGSAIVASEDTTNQIAQTTGLDAYTGLRTGATTNVKVAQQITVGGSNITVNRVALWLKSNGTLAYTGAKTLTVTLETNSAGAPSGTPATNGTSSTIEVYNINPQGEWIFFDFGSNVTLTASTVYWIVLQGTTTADATNYISWGNDSTSGGYAGGDSAKYDGTNWTGSAAGVDYLFSMNLNHSRDITLTNVTMNLTGTCVFMDWVRNVTVSGGGGCTTTAGPNGALYNIAQTFSGNPVNSLILDGIAVSNSDTSENLIQETPGSEVNYINKIYVRGLTGTLGSVLKLNTYTRKLYFGYNTLTILSPGNTPFDIGKEVDGVDPQTFNYYPFSQIVFEKNYLTYTGVNHNHLMRFAIGADNGIFRNNTVLAPKQTDSGNQWGFVIKANNWKFVGNSIYGVCPAITIYGTNNSYVTNNTVKCYTSGGDGAILIRSHQDNIYGTTKEFGLPFYNYVEDNIVISDDLVPALDYGATTNYGIGRTSNYWSNIVDNNIYYAPTNNDTAEYQTNGQSQQNLTTLSGLQTIWASSTWTDSTSLSQNNDTHNSLFTNPGLLNPVNGNFQTSSSSIKGKAQNGQSNIGSYQSSGSGGNTKIGLSI